MARQSASEAHARRWTVLRFSGGTIHVGATSAQGDILVLSSNRGRREVMQEEFQAELFGSHAFFLLLIDVRSALQSL